jgi:hypothetical protein
MILRVSLAIALFGDLRKVLPPEIEKDARMWKRYSQSVGAGWTGTRENSSFKCRGDSDART